MCYLKPIFIMNNLILRILFTNIYNLIYNKNIQIDQNFRIINKHININI